MVFNVLLVFLIVSVSLLTVGTRTTDVQSMTQGFMHPATQTRLSNCGCLMLACGTPPSVCIVDSAVNWAFDAVYGVQRFLQSGTLLSRHWRPDCPLIRLTCGTSQLSARA